jgi:hypothetical protein
MASVEPWTDQLEPLEKLALFFYFSFMDEGRAHAATLKALRRLRSFKSRFQGEDWQTSLVRETNAILRESSEMGGVSRIGLSQRQVKFPEGSDWGAWFSFRKASHPETFSVVIWVKILGLPIDAVARGLGISTGAVLFRLNTAMKELGHLRSMGGAQ